MEWHCFVFPVAYFNLYFNRAEFLTWLAFLEDISIQDEDVGWEERGHFWGLFILMAIQTIDLHDKKAITIFRMADSQANPFGCTRGPWPGTAGHHPVNHVWPVGSANGSGGCNRAAGRAGHPSWGRSRWQRWSNAEGSINVMKTGGKGKPKKWPRGSFVKVERNDFLFVWGEALMWTLHFSSVRTQLHNVHL